MGDSKAVGIGDPEIGDPIGNNLWDGVRLVLWQEFLRRKILVTFVGPFASASSAEATASSGGHHAAVSGSIISDMTSVVAARIATYKPHVLIIDTATNDVDGGSTTTAAITTNYNALLDTARGADATLPIAMVKCIPLLSPNGVTFMSSCYTQLDAIFAARSPSDSNLYYPDCSGFANRPGMYSTRFVDGNQDQYHPSHYGYYYMAVKYLMPVLLTIPVLGTP